MSLWLASLATAFVASVCPRRRAFAQVLVELGLEARQVDLQTVDVPLGNTGSTRGEPLPRLADGLFERLDAVRLRRRQQRRRARALCLGETRDQRRGARALEKTKGQLDVTLGAVALEAFDDLPNQIAVHRLREPGEIVGRPPGDPLSALPLDHVGCCEQARDRAVELAALRLDPGEVLEGVPPAARPRPLEHPSLPVGCVRCILVGRRQDVT